VIEEITKSRADSLLKEKYGYFGPKLFKGSFCGGKYVAEHKGKFYSCGKLSEAAKVLGLV
jgi:hypothetical protein